MDTVIDIQRKARNLVNNEVLHCASRLNAYLLHHSRKFQSSYWDVCRIPMDDDGVEFYEAWIVTSWLADKLLEEGEAVLNFEGVNFWQRTTTGQAIYIDTVIQKIALS